MTPLGIAIFQALGIEPPNQGAKPFDRHSMQRPLEEVPDAQLIALWDRNSEEWDETGCDHAPPGDHFYSLIEDCHLELNLRGLGQHCAC